MPQILRMEWKVTKHLFIDETLQFHELQARWTIKKHLNKSFIGSQHGRNFDRLDCFTGRFSVAHSLNNQNFLAAPSETD